MRKTIAIAISTVLLTACGGSDQTDENVTPKNSVNTFYAFNNFDPVQTGANMKYNIDKKNNLVVTDTFARETFNNYLTQDGYSTTSPPQLDKTSYLLGENASFDGEKLEYSVSNYSQTKPLIFSYHFKKVDVSNVFIGDDVNNPIRQLYSSVTGQILANYLGIPSLSELGVFPKGSICWQKLSKISSQDYIEFYAPIATENLQIFVDAQIEATGTWNNVTWIRYKDHNNPNTKLTIEGKEYWGQYHDKNEYFKPEPNQLVCDFMNEQAYQAAYQPLKRFVESPK